MDERIAVIDIGSTSIRVVIYSIKANGAYKMVDQAKEYVRLARGAGRSKLLPDSAIQEAIRCLKLFKKFCEAHHVTEIIAVATAATRNAVNRGSLIDAVHKETGLQVEIITGEREAYLDFLGVVNSMSHSDYVLIDVGGGSTEVVMVKERQLVNSLSIPMGSMVLSESFGSNNDHRRRMEQYVYEHLLSVTWLEEAKGLPIVGVGGSARTLAKIDKRRLNHPLKGLHNYRLVPELCLNMYDHLSRMTPGQRRRVKGLDSQRVDIIVGGLAPIMGIIKMIEPPMIYISDHGIRNGLFFERYLARSHKSLPVVQNVLQHSVHNILLNQNQNMGHCYHVQGLAMELFDQLSSVHFIPYEFRNVLQVGAALHDIGKQVNLDNYNQHSFYLIIHSVLHGLANREKVMAAFVAALHNSNESLDIPFRSYQAVLQPGDEDIIRKMALLAEMADILDRSESQAVRKFRSYIDGDKVKLILDLANGRADIEYAAAERVQKAFMKLFDKTLYIM